MEVHIPLVRHDLQILQVGISGIKFYNHKNSPK